MRRFWLGEDVLDQESRNAILKAIGEARAVARDVDTRLAALPGWALAPDSPLGEDRQRLLDATQVRRANEPAVTGIEQRLLAPSAMWPALSVDEKASLDAWIGAVAEQGDVLDKYLPSELTKDLRKLALLVIGMGSLFAPLLWTEEGPPGRPILPFRFPDWPVPGIRRPPAFVPPTAAPPRAAPFRTLPAPTAAAAAAIPVPVAPFRPGGAPPSPFQRVGPAAAAPPLATVEIAPGVFRPAGMAPPGARPIVPGPHIPVYPRYQRAT